MNIVESDLEIPIGLSKIWFVSHLQNSKKIQSWLQVQF